MSVFFRKRGTIDTVIKSASNYAIGEKVYLYVGGVLTEFIVVRQVSPDGELYDNSCNGTLLLCNSIIKKMKWNSSITNYASSEVHTYLNDTFFNLLDDNVKEVVKEVRLPYISTIGSSVVSSGENGLTTKVFILSAAEISSTSTTRDGIAISYPASVAYFEDLPTQWWTRSISTTSNENFIYTMNTEGNIESVNSSELELGVRPALILPYNAKFDENANLFRGVW